MGFNGIIKRIEAEVDQGKFQTSMIRKTTPASTTGWVDLSMGAGNPSANFYASEPLVAATLNGNKGIYHGGNVSTDTKHLVNIGAYSAVATAVPSVLMLVDICLYYPGIVTTSASAQTLTNSTSLTRYTDGAGLRAFFVMTTAAGANTPTVQISYTNQAGTASRSLPVTTAFTASAIVGHITHSGTAANNYGPFLPLASGDTGVRSVQSLTITTPSATSGTGALVLCRPLATLPLTTVSVASERDLFNQLPSLPKIVDGACLTWLYFAGAATATSTNIYGYCDFAWG